MYTVLFLMALNNCIATDFFCDLFVNFVWFQQLGITTGSEAATNIISYLSHRERGKRNVNFLKFQNEIIIHQSGYPKKFAFHLNDNFKYADDCTFVVHYFEASDIVNIKKGEQYQLFELGANTLIMTKYVTRHEREMWPEILVKKDAASVNIFFFNACR